MRARLSVLIDALVEFVTLLIKTMTQILYKNEDESNYLVTYMQRSAFFTQTPLRLNQPQGVLDKQIHYSSVFTIWVWKFGFGNEISWSKICLCKVCVITKITKMYKYTTHTLCIYVITSTRHNHQLQNLIISQLVNLCVHTF